MFNWQVIFSFFFVSSSNFIKDLGFKISDDEINEYVEKMDGDLNLEKFIEIMKNIELKNRK